MPELVSSGPLVAGLMMHAWVDLAIFIVSLYLAFRLRGGQLIYPVLLIGITGLVGFATQAVNGTEVTWVISMVKSLVLLLVALSLLQILKA